LRVLPQDVTLWEAKHLRAASMTGLGNTLSTFPNFAAYFAVGGALTALFVALYSNMTPHREIALIRAGNVAAAIALTGALVGFVIPLASVVAHSAGIRPSEREIPASKVALAVLPASMLCGSPGSTSRVTIKPPS
jgi:hypothetical protein